MKTPKDYLTSFANINIELLDRIKETKNLIEQPTVDKILENINKTNTKTILPLNWKWR